MFDLSVGPLLAEFFGLAFQFDLGEGAGHFTLEGVDSGPNGTETGGKIHGFGSFPLEVFVRGTGGDSTGECWDEGEIKKLVVQNESNRAILVWRLIVGNKYVIEWSPEVARGKCQ